jgi:hypothetical protein
VTVKRPERSDLAFSRLPQTAALVARDHPPVSNIARLKRACSGYPTKIILRLVESKWILISALVAKSAPAKVLTVHFLMAVPGTRSRWYRLTIGKLCTGSRSPMRHPHLQHKNHPQITQIYLCNLWLTAFAVNPACSLMRPDTSFESA